MKKARSFILLLLFALLLSCHSVYASDSVTMKRTDYEAIKNYVKSRNETLTTVSAKSEALEKRLITVSQKSEKLETQLETAQSNIQKLSESLKRQTKKTESEKNKNKVYKVLLAGLSAYIIAK